MGNNGNHDENGEITNIGAENNHAVNINRHDKNAKDTVNLSEKS
jgi:hypothetical protein